MPEVSLKSNRMNRKQAKHCKAAANRKQKLSKEQTIQYTDFTCEAGRLAASASQLLSARPFGVTAEPTAAV